MSQAARSLATLSESEVEVEERHVRGRVPRAGRAVQGLIRDLDRAGIDLDSIEVHRPTLDDVFLALTGRSLRDAESTSTDAKGADGPDGGGGASGPEGGGPEGGGQPGQPGDGAPPDRPAGRIGTQASQGALQ